MSPGLGEHHQEHWDSRSQSPYLNDQEEKHVMDLSNYNPNGGLLMSNGGNTVLRRVPSGPPSPCSSHQGSPAPGQHSVITSLASMQLQQHPHPYRNSYYHMSPPLTIQHRLDSSPDHQMSEASSNSRRKKLPQPIPEECKDDAYWERRKRNNESAKRSREMRRTKEVQTARRVNELETENLQLRTEVNMLRDEVEKLRQLLIPKTSVSNS